MDTSKIKSGIIALLFLAVVCLATCELRKKHSTEIADGYGQELAARWVNEKESMVSQYENKIGRLQQAKDSLWFLVKVGKVKTVGIRLKRNGFDDRLKQVTQGAILIPVVRDSIIPLVDSLIVSQLASDSACDETVTRLETIVGNRDSSLQFHKQIEDKLRDIQKEQDLKNKYLSDQLEIAFKEQRRKTKQNKFLSAGLLFISGVFVASLIPRLNK